jgi:uncharacterized damage-inducible protein DinB
MNDHLRFPIGRYQKPADLSYNALQEYIDEIEALPDLLFYELEKLAEFELDEPYRPGGWTKRQVVHHIADSHMNSYIRFRWTLTEDTPTIKAYDEKKWAELPDARNESVEVSLALIRALHERWVLLLRAMSPEDMQRSFIHPEGGKTYTLAELIPLYAWHGKHHLGHLALEVDE